MLGTRLVLLLILAPALILAESPFGCTPGSVQKYQLPHPLTLSFFSLFGFVLFFSFEGENQYPAGCPENSVCFRLDTNPGSTTSCTCVEGFTPTVENRILVSCTPDDSTPNLPDACGDFLDGCPQNAQCVETTELAMCICIDGSIQPPFYALCFPDEPFFPRTFL